MKFAKKVILSLSIITIMLMAAVLGIAGNLGVFKSNNINSETATSVGDDKGTYRPGRPQTFTFSEDEVIIQKGSSDINFTYYPGVNANASSKRSYAYEYTFNNPMTSELAVGLKDIKVSGVTLSYVYSDTKLSHITSSATPFTTQTIASNGTKYIYIIVTPDQKVPSSFQTNVVWFQGKLGTLTIHNTDGSTTTQNIVKGQSLQDTLVVSIAEVGPYGVEWYSDVNCTTLADTRTQGGTVYVRVPNLPTDWINLYSSYYEIKKGSSALPSHLVIPASYNGKNITSIQGNSYASSSKFYRQRGLVSVNLPHTITSITVNAFYECTHLTKINIPSGVTSIGNSAFSGCDKLLEVYNLSGLTITKGATTNGGVGQYALDIYTSMATPSKLVEIGGINYYKQSDTSYIATGLIDTTKTSVTLDSRTTAINQYAFYQCSSLTSVTLPSSLTSIGNKAFSSCSSLTSITLPSSLTSIGKYAFSSCSSLTSITLPSSLTSIGEYAFSDCSGLTSVGDLSKCTNLTILEAGTFYYCSSLTSVTLPSGLTSIGNVAFRDCRLTSITIPEDVTSIGSSVFEFCDSLTQVILPTSLTSLGNGSFSYCDALTSVDLSKCTNLTSIGQSTFFSCDNLTEVILPTNLTSIGNTAFRQCRSLISVALPSSLTSIGNAAFQDCYNLAEVYNLSTSLTITKGDTGNGYVGYYAQAIYTSVDTPSNLVIIDGVNYYKESDTSYIVAGLADPTKTTITLDSRTTSITQYAFYENTTLTSVDSSNCAGLTSIGQSAFQFCSSLTSVGDLSKCTSLTSIGQSAFQSCSSLTSVDLGNCTNLTSIGQYAFSNCSSLTSITLPSSLTSIGSSAFSDCSSLISITLPSSLTSIGNYVFDDCSSLITITLPSSLTSIGSSAFQNCRSLTSITIPSGVTSIGNYAFNNCYGLTSITLPSGVTSIGSSAFNNCRSLTSITIPSGVTSIGNYAFCNCYSLTSITLPSSLTSIGTYAFQSCNSLTSADLSKCTSLTSIGSNAFYICYSLTKVVLPTSLTSIGSSAFQYCYGLVEVYDLSTSLSISKGSSSYGYIGYYAKSVYTSLDTPSKVVTIGNVQYYKESDNSYIAVASVSRNKTRITLDSRTTSINTYAFSKWGNLKNIEFSHCTNLTTIGNYAFQECTGLTSINLPSSLTSVGSYTFYNCASLNNIDLRQCTSLTSVGSYTFYNCASLTNINLPSSLTSVGNNTFYNCTSLTNINLPSSLTSIGNNTFYNCASLNNIDLRQCTSLTGIGLYTFYNCTSLTNINLSSSLTSIGDYVFAYCSSLKTIDLSNEIANIGYGAFYNCSSLISINLPSGLTTIGSMVFENCTNLNNPDFSKCTNLTSIGGSCFKNCTKFTNIDLSKCLSLTSIANSAFESCSGLVNVDLPSGITSIGDQAFYNCTSLTSVDLSKCTSLTRIGPSAFRNCTSLTTIDLSKCTRLTNIWSYAFQDCTSLTSITIPRSVMNIASYAFSGCTNMQTITFEDVRPWYRTSSSNSTGGEVVDVTNPTQNATWLKGTDGYHNYYWYNGGNNLVLNANGGTFEDVSGAEDYEYTFEIEGGGTVTCPETEDDYYPNYGFTLGDDGYWISGNQYICDEIGDSSYALARVTFTANAGDTITFTVIHSGEEGYDYGIFGYLDTALSADPWDDGDYYHQAGSNSTETVTYTIETTGTHFIDIKYIKDGSYYEGEDCIKFMFGDIIYDYTSGTTNVADGDVSQLATPVREGYTFVGWFTAAEGGTQVTYIDDNMTLYAHWREN